MALILADLCHVDLNTSVSRDNRRKGFLGNSRSARLVLCPRTYRGKASVAPVIMNLVTEGTMFQTSAPLTPSLIREQHSIFRIKIAFYD